jgi:hypothetical protein
MKKILITLMILGVAGSWCFAQQAPKPIKIVPKVAIETKSLTGTVDSVTLADPVKGTKSEIVVLDDKSNKTAFSVIATTTIYDKDMNPTTLDKIKKDDAVKIRYTVTKEGVNEASSIILMK